jgi:multisubunit Na+/H+ antiporter MnhB subunit
MPGEGFSAGLLVAVSILLLHIGLGYEAAEHRLPRGLRWALPAGLGLAVATGLWGLLQGRGFLTHAKVTLPFGNEHLSLSTSILFDVAIFLLVGGGAYQIFQILGKEESV